MRRIRHALLAAVVALGIPGASAAAAEDASAAAVEGATYAPPYADGPAGGGAGSLTDRGADGRVTVGRLYPAPGPFNCPRGGAYAKFEVAHTLTGPVTTITADLADAAVDQFVFAVLSARDEDGIWLGTRQQRGPLLVDARLSLDLDPALFEGEDGYRPGDVLAIQFGLEMASACPQVNGGTVRFTQITVS